MSGGGHRLAQANIARMRAPIDDPLMAEFVAQLDTINGVADESPGFIWRLQTEEGDATAIRAFDDELILFNMSVWESVEALFQYVYKSNHVIPFSNRKQWFLPTEGPSSVLWWIPAGHLPSVEEAKQRLEYLQENGPSPDGFTFAKKFPPPAGGPVGPGGG